MSNPFKTLLGTVAPALALLLAPVAVQAAADVAPSTEATPIVHAKPAMWVVKDKDTTIYLFGTIHLMRPGTQWLEGQVKQAFDSAPELVLEIADQDDPAIQSRIVQRALSLSGPPLSSRLPAELQPRLEDMLRGSPLPLAVFDRMQPWFAAVSLTSLPLVKLGYDPKLGIDNQLRAAAKADGKAIVGLETSEEQIGFFENLSEELQMSLLIETIEEQDEMDKTLNEMIAAWSAGDADKLALTINQSMEEDKELEKLLLFDRNQRWADWIKARLEQPGTVFLAVGAGHLAGKGNLRDALKERGLKSRTVKSR